MSFGAYYVLIIFYKFHCSKGSKICTLYIVTCFLHACSCIIVSVHQNVKDCLIMNNDYETLESLHYKAI